MGNETDVKLEAAGLGDEEVVTLGDDQRANAGGGEIAQKVMCIVGGSRSGDGRTQVALIVDDRGNQASSALPQTADTHGRNSSRAV